MSFVYRVVRHVSYMQDGGLISIGNIGGERVGFVILLDPEIQSGSYLFITEFLHNDHHLALHVYINTKWFTMVFVVLQ